MTYYLIEQDGMGQSFASAEQAELYLYEISRRRYVKGTLGTVVIFTARIEKDGKKIAVEELKKDADSARKRRRSGKWG